MIGWLRQLLMPIRRRRAYTSRVASFAREPVVPGDIVFLGDSITESGSWEEWFPALPIRNRGVSADRTAGVIKRLDQVLNGPALLFLMIGTNDLGAGVAAPQVVDNVASILTTIRQHSPTTLIYLQSVLPRSVELAPQIRLVNESLQALAVQREVEYIDLFSSFADLQGAIVSELSDDQLHLTAAGYEKWRAAIAPLLAAR